MVAPLTRPYHARSVVRLGGHQLQGWAPRMVAMIAKQQRAKVGEGDGGGQEYLPAARLKRPQSRRSLGPTDR